MKHFISVALFATKTKLFEGCPLSCLDQFITENIVTITYLLCGCDCELKLIINQVLQVHVQCCCWFCSDCRSYRMAGQGSQTVPGDVAYTRRVGQTHLQLGQSAPHKVFHVPILSLLYTGLPMMRSLRVFDALEPKFTPFKFVSCMELTL